MQRETIAVEDIRNIKLDSIYAATYIRPAQGTEIELEYTTQHNFQVLHKVVSDTLIITAEVNSLLNLGGTGPMLCLYLPENRIDKLIITGNASFVELRGEEGMYKTCIIDVSAAVTLLENISADTTVKNITGAVRLKNQTVCSNINLETQVGVIDVTLDEVPDDVSFYTRGILRRNSLLRTRGERAQNERYVLRAKSALGLINVHS